jgi:hypothetical protein
MKVRISGVCFTLVLVASLLAVAGCGDNGNSKKEHFVPVPATVAPPPDNVYQLSPTPTATRLRAAQAALGKGGMVESIGGDVDKINGWFGINITGASNAASAPKAVAFRIASNGALHSMAVYSSGDVYDSDSDTKPLSWLGALRNWEESENAPRGTPQPPAGAWTELSEWSKDYSDGKANHIYDHVYVYRLNTNSKKYDWYLFFQQPYIRPYYYDPHCKGDILGKCGWYNKNLTITESFYQGGADLYDWSPTSTKTNSTVSVSVGGGLSDNTPAASASFSTSYSQSSVTTSDESRPNDNVAEWNEQFNHTGCFQHTPDTSRAGFQSYNAAIYKFPASSDVVSSPTIKINAKWEFWRGAGFRCNQTYSNPLIFILPHAIHPPLLSVTRTALRVAPGSGGSAIFTVNARIPDSGYGLNWKIVNAHPTWLNLSQTSGSGTATITVTAEPNAPIGSVATLNIDTDPPNAAPQVRKGPLQVQVTVVKKGAFEDTGVLVTGGFDNAGMPLASAERYDPRIKSFVPEGSMTTPRARQIQVTLPSGNILVAGGVTDAHHTPTKSAELFNLDTGTFGAVGNMTTPRRSARAVLLHNGKVLIVGGIIGTSSADATATAELYDPKTKTFSATGSMTTAREYPTATRLESGDVLVAGGEGSDGKALQSAEVYNPRTGKFSSVGDMTTARFEDTSTLTLIGGEVLIAGGYGDKYQVLKSAEVFNPATRKFTSTLLPMCEARANFTATLLTHGDWKGNVLAVGGEQSGDPVKYLDTTGQYASGIGFPCGSMPRPKLPMAMAYQTATLMTQGAQAGELLYVGGHGAGGRLNAAEVLDEKALKFTPVGGMSTARADAGVSEIR